MMQPHVIENVAGVGYEKWLDGLDLTLLPSDGREVVDLGTQPVGAWHGTSFFTRHSGLLTLNFVLNV